MHKPSDSDREFWRSVLRTGGFTMIPRWTTAPVRGTAEHHEAVPEDLVSVLLQLEGASQLGSVLLAAHAKVLATLTGEPEVTTGYVTAQGTRVLPCRLTAEPASWRSLVQEARLAESRLLAYQQCPLDGLMRELGLSEPLFETVFSLDGAGDRLREDTVLWVGFPRHDGRMVLRLWYRTDVLDAAGAARIAGYHLTALRLIAADADSGHRRQSLLSPDELRTQLEGLAGPCRELPDLRPHELFEERVRAHPDAVALVHGERQWSYRELNLRANRLARALLARGLEHEGVVAVVTERDLDWAAAVLAILKAGGVYLPVEPRFPADRIATMLSRAGCRLAVTGPDSTETLDQALETVPGVHTLCMAAVDAEGHEGNDLGLVVTPDQLAYIYFTSGSTGEPKGAMCEHAGMLNHLQAKIEDLGIGEGQVVAQTAPQCFDISLWQLLSALLTGGRTLLVEQEVILDVPRFVDKIAGSRVSVLQLVPSYLEAVLSHLELRPRQLPALQVVSVTGEALKKELVQRWFTAVPGIRLVNAYGLTETSDDTNHEIMDRPPAGDRVPLGPCINNVHVYVLDEHLQPVPLGAPGEIAFSGVCVGRGYINDAERTRQAFLADPHRPGNRLYRSGDFGRWLPEGALEFLGRRDSQVKVRGFRIEIGDIENALLRVPGVRDGAVVVAERADRGTYLVAFHSGARSLDAGVLRERLGAVLPPYMVPSAFYWRARLPLTANSKTDRKALTALAAQLDVDGEPYDAPCTPIEQWLAGSWANVLGIPEDRISRQDHFFERGGTSLSAVKLAIALDRAVTLADITRHPVLADLAKVVDSGPEQRGGLLHRLSVPDGEHSGDLVCFPCAGGHAVSFQPLAASLRQSGYAVHAVELPGHDSSADGEPFELLRQVVDRAVAEILRLGSHRLLLWGHSSGTAFAVETARRLEVQGVHVERVFLAAQLLGDVTNRRTAVTRLSRLSDAEIARELVTDDDGYAELEQLDAQPAERTGAAYRHDCVSAHRYFADALVTPPAVRLSAPLTVVVAEDDPHTRDFQHRYADWRLLADDVGLCRLTQGGHHFPQSRPLATAQVVQRATERPASP